ncbi:MAG: 5'-nucleotidase, lipoprotein e(P4) family [Flavobacterium sp.]|nr:MAG: 5'-nucleotidase, lipoprotein e(P4) family [Flavobacterium sp.]
MKKIIVILIAFTGFIGCKSSVPTKSLPVNQSAKAELQNIDVNGKLYAAVYQQRAAEYKALCIQSFNIAKFRLDEQSQSQSVKPMAIISDIDETFLDNSPYAVEMAKRGQTYDQATWLEWTSKAMAEPLAGSLEFFKYAASKGVVIFYITNRSVKDKPGTVANLKKYDFPFADDQHVIVREIVSSKEPRRQEVAKRFNIVLLLGDNLSDFSDLFDKKTEAERGQNVIGNAAQFGKRFIILPNTGYGDWESAIFDYDFKKTEVQKDSIYLSKVKGF